MKRNARPALPREVAGALADSLTRKALGVGALAAAQLHAPDVLVRLPARLRDAVDEPELSLILAPLAYEVAETFYTELLLQSPDVGHARIMPVDEQLMFQVGAGEQVAAQHSLDDLLQEQLFRFTGGEPLQGAYLRVMSAVLDGMDTVMPRLRHKALADLSRDIRVMYGAQMRAEGLDALLDVRAALMGCVVRAAQEYDDWGPDMDAAAFVQLRVEQARRRFGPFGQRIRTSAEPVL